MTDQIELTAIPTPNPNTIKFNVNYTFFELGSITFNAEDDLTSSPLAEKLFSVTHVEGVMVGVNFISITKQRDGEWAPLLEATSAIIRDVLATSDQPVDLDLLKAAQEVSEEDSDAIQKIKHVLDTEIRPAIAMDGGDCEFYSYQDGVLTLRLQGACSTCPSATMTLKMGIESRLKEEVPELKDVVQI